MQKIGLLLKVLWSPGEAMFELSKSPSIIVPLVFLTLCSLAAGALVMAKVDPAEMALRAIERSPQGSQMSEEQKEQLRKTLSSPVVKVFGVASALISPSFIVLLLGSIYFGLFSMVGREGGFKAFLSITAFASVPQIIRQAATVLQVYVIPMSQLMPDELGSIGAGYFLNRDSVSPLLFTAVSMVDLVTIWILALLIIGYGFVTRKSLSKVTRAAVVLAPFFLYVCIRLALAALQGRG